jgi:hypothetical protein
VDRTGSEWEALELAVLKLWALRPTAVLEKFTINIRKVSVDSPAILSSNTDTLDRIPPNTETERRCRF